MSQLLSQKLSGLRRKRATITTLVAGVGVVGVLVLLIALTMIFDWWLELPRGARASMLAVESAVLVYTIVWQIIRPIVYGPDDEELALAVEQESPEFRSRLISVVQLAKAEAAGNSGVSTTMVSELVRETEQLAGPVDFNRVVKIDRLASLGTIAGLIVVAFGLAAMMTAPASVALIQRAALMNVPVPRKTIVECLSKDMTVPRGESVTITAKASGLIIPAGGQVKVTSPAGMTQTYELPRDKGSGDHYRCTIDNVQDHFTYAVYLNDGHSEDFKVSASIRPAVANIECKQKFPDYTNAGTVKRQTGDLSILQGSRLLINILANKPVKVTAATDKPRNYVHLHGSEVDFPLRITSGDGTKLYLQDAGELGIPLPAGTTGFSVHLVDQDGLTSKNPAIYPITLIPDAPPKITVTSPKRSDELVTAQATVEVGFDASDDFGVNDIFLLYRVLDPDGKSSAVDGAVPETTVLLPISPGKSVRGIFPWRISDIAANLPLGTMIQWRLQVRDNNNVTGPGVTNSEPLRQLRLVSPADKRKELMDQMADTLTQIDSIKEGQSQNQQRTADLVTGTPTTAPTGRP